MNKNLLENETIKEGIELRNKLIDLLTNNRTDLKELKADTKLAELVLRAIKDNDNTVLSIAKMEVDSDNADKQLQSKQLALAILSNINPSEHKVSTESSNTNKKSLTEEDGKRDYVEGELSIGEQYFSMEDLTDNH